jgi:hypothetical protein
LLFVSVIVQVPATEDRASDIFAAALGIMIMIGD